MTSTEGLTATCVTALGLPNLQGLRPNMLALCWHSTLTCHAGIFDAGQHPPTPLGIPRPTPALVHIFELQMTTIK